MAKTSVPDNLLPTSPVTESLPTGGPIAESLIPVNAGLTSVLGWFDMAAWGAFRIQMKVAAFGGTLAVVYSMDDLHTVLVAGAALPAVVAGVAYDSGLITPVQGAQWAQVTYTQAGGGASGAFFFRIMVPSSAGGGGGGGGGVIVTVNLDGEVESLPAPDPASIPGVTAPLVVKAEPDGALRTRARVLTDEGAVVDDFNGPDPDVWQLIGGGAVVTLAPGLATFSGNAAAFAALKAGDYIETPADDLPATPAWTQIRSLNLATLTGVLESGYAGAAGGVGVAVRRSTWCIYYAGVGATVGTATSELGLQPGVANGSECSLSRWLGFAGRKGFMPVRMIAALKLANWDANQENLCGFFNNPLYSAITAGIWIKLRSATTIRVYALRDGQVVNKDVTLPLAAVTSVENKYELEIEPSLGLSLWINGIGPMPLGVGISHMFDPYLSVYAAIIFKNVGVPGGAWNLISDVIEVEEIDLLEARTTQPDARKLNAQVQDVTPRTFPTGQAYTFVADASVQVATVMVGRRYRIVVEGGAGCVINTDSGVASRITDQSYYGHDNWDEFTATRADIYGQTLIAASAFSTVKFIPVN